MATPRREQILNFIKEQGGKGVNREELEKRFKDCKKYAYQVVLELTNYNQISKFNDRWYYATKEDIQSFLDGIDPTSEPSRSIPEGYILVPIEWKDNPLATGVAAKPDAIKVNDPDKLEVEFDMVEMKRQAIQGFELYAFYMGVTGKWKEQTESAVANTNPDDATYTGNYFIKEFSLD